MWSSTTTARQHVRDICGVVRQALDELGEPLRPLLDDEDRRHRVDVWAGGRARRRLSCPGEQRRQRRGARAGHDGLSVAPQIAQAAVITHESEPGMVELAAYYSLKHGVSELPRAT